MIISFVSPIFAQGRAGGLIEVRLRADRGDDALCIRITPAGRLMFVRLNNLCLFDRRKGAKRLRTTTIRRLRHAKDIALRAIAARALGVDRPEFEVEL